MSAFNLTDKNWTNGVSNSVAAFFVSNTAENIKKYKTGDHVKFANGDTRTIQSTTASSHYLSVFLNGESMDGFNVGYPHEIKVINEGDK